MGDAALFYDGREMHEERRKRLAEPAELVYLVMFDGLEAFVMNIDSIWRDLGAARARRDELRREHPWGTPEGWKLEIRAVPLERSAAEWLDDPFESWLDAEPVTDDPAPVRTPCAQEREVGMTLRDEIAGELAASRVGGKMNVYMGGEHNPRPSEYRQADDILAAVAEALTSDAAVDAASTAYEATYSEVHGGGNLVAVLTAALRAAGVTKGEGDE